METLPNLRRVRIIIEVEEGKEKQLETLIDEFLDKVYYYINPVRMEKKWGW